MLTIYHNNRCGKSRTACAILEASGKAIEVIDYLKHPPSATEMKRLLQMLGLRPLELIRTKETIFQEKFKGQQHSDAEWIEIMIANPILIERPIVVSGEKAWLVRSPEALEELSGYLI